MYNILYKLYYIDSLVDGPIRSDPMQCIFIYYTNKCCCLCQVIYHCNLICDSGQLADTCSMVLVYLVT